jgi:hypothetical protein
MSILYIAAFVAGAGAIAKQALVVKKAYADKAKKQSDADNDVDCVPGTWEQEWSACSTTNCDGVRKIRRLGDTGGDYGDQCSKDEYTMPCNGPSCNTDCLLNPWSDWSKCAIEEGGADINLSCEGVDEGRKYRYRSIYSGNIPDAGGDCPVDYDMSRKQFLPCVRDNSCPFIRDYYGYLGNVVNTPGEQPSPSNAPDALGDFVVQNAQIKGWRLGKSALHTPNGSTGSAYELIGKFDGSVILNGSTVEGDSHAFNYVTQWGQPYRWTITKHPTNSNWLRFVGLGTIDPGLDPLTFTIEKSSGAFQ